LVSVVAVAVVTLVAVAVVAEVSVAVVTLVSVAVVVVVVVVTGSADVVLLLLLLLTVEDDVDTVLEDVEAVDTHAALSLTVATLNGLYPPGLSMPVLASKWDALYTNAPEYAGLLSGPAKNFQLLFATCTTESPTVHVFVFTFAYSAGIAVRTTTNFFGSSLSCVASTSPPYNPASPLETVRRPDAAATEPRTGLPASTTPTSNSTRVPGRGAPPASFESSTVTTKPHNGAAVLSEVTDTK